MLLFIILASIIMGVSKTMGVANVVILLFFRENPGDPLLFNLMCTPKL